MERRAFLAIAISFLILWGWTMLFKPTPPPRTVPQPTTEPVMTEPALPAPERDAAAGEGEPLPVEAITAETAQEIRTGNRYFEVVWTNRGGRVVSWKLTNGEYTTREGDPLELLPGFAGEHGYQLALDLDDRGLADVLNGALYQVERDSLSGDEVSGPGERVTFTWSDGRGLEARKSFTIWRDAWLVDVDVEVSDRGRRLPARLALGPGFGAQEPDQGRATYYYKSQGVWNQAGRVTHKRPKGLIKEEGGVSGGLTWAGLEDQYFAALVLPGESERAARWRALEVMPLPRPWDDPDEAPEARLEPVFSVSVGAGAQIYMGPKRFTLLRGMGNQLERVVWFSSFALLGAIAKFIFLVLIWIEQNIVSNYGVAIILATGLLRTLLFPLNQYAMVKMRKAQQDAQKLQPKIKSIKAKYSKKKDAESRNKMQQEIMKLYKKEGINPMGGVTGCLPMLVQFPILIGFYNMLTVVVELRGAPFMLWIQDLSLKDPYWVIPLLMGVTMFVQQKLAMSKVKDPMQQQQQKFMMFMPFFFTWICLQMPSGMVLYWFVNNLLGIGQQWLVNRQTRRVEPAAQKA